MCPNVSLWKKGKKVKRDTNTVMQCTTTPVPADAGLDLDNKYMLTFLYQSSFIYCMQVPQYLQNKRM
jgi:hypothetical protein